MFTEILDNKFLLFQSILNSSDNSIFSVDLNNRYLVFNKQHMKTMRRMYGVHIRTGMDLMSVIKNAEDKNVLRSALKRAMGGENFSEIQEYGNGKNGRAKFDFRFTPVKDEDKVIGVTVSSRQHYQTDWTADEIKLAERIFKTIFENSHDGIFLEDEGGYIIDVNPAGCNIQEQTRESIIGRNILEFIPDEYRVQVLRDYKSLFYGSVKYIESWVWTSTGTQLPVEISGNRIIYQGRDVLLLLVRDTSERKKIEAEREQMLLEKSRRRQEIMLESLRIREEERIRIASDIHDEVGGGLSTISILCQLLKRQKPGTSASIANVEKILQAAKEVQQNIGDIIWAMNPNNDSLENLLSYMNYYFSEFIESSGLNFTIHHPGQIPEVMLTGNIRRNIFLVVKEALHNVIKHSMGSYVDVEVLIENQMLQIKVLDNGRGFNSDDVPCFKNGIKNMKRRIASINGKISIQSRATAGTTVLISIPFPSEYVER